MTREVISDCYDACVIGAGPAGLAAALELARYGLTVALVESGVEGTDTYAQHLSDAEIDSPTSHSVMDEAVRRGLGGTSAIWGGRCVPLDAIDFEERSYVAGARWPFDFEELQPFYGRACQLLDVGAPNFAVGSMSAGTSRDRLLSTNFVDNHDLCATTLERWSRKPNSWKLQKSMVEREDRITVLTGMTCVGFTHSACGSPVNSALLRATGLQDAPPKSLVAKVFVVACGGVESTRLVLNSMREANGLKLESSSMVGRYYMGHPSGKIADIQLNGNPEDTIYGFEIDDGVYVRRRITFMPKVQRKHSLLNIAFWFDNTPIADWQHGSGVLSAAYLALTAPLIGRFLAPAAIRKRATGDAPVNRLLHIRNCLCSPINTLVFCISFCHKRYFANPRVPGFFTYSSANRYALHYHAEHAPSWESRIQLSDSVDMLGMRRARINLVWSDQDIDSILKAHSVLDASLQKNGIGKLIYRYDKGRLGEVVRAQAVDGFHQIGTLRMADSPKNGVTDKFGRLFGTTNCFIASSAIFPTSGQANPTLALIALTVRQAEHIANRLNNEIKQYA